MTQFYSTLLDITAYNYCVITNYDCRWKLTWILKLFWVLFTLLFEQLSQNPNRMHILHAGFTANLKIRKIMKLSWNLKRDPFLVRNQGKLQRKYFPVKDFVLALFSVMHFFWNIFMFWNILLNFFALSIVLQLGFLWLKIWVFQFNILDCCMMHHNCMKFYLLSYWSD